MKILLVLAGLAVIVVLAPLLTDELRDRRDAPSDLERSMQNLDKSMERLNKANQRLGH